MTQEVHKHNLLQMLVKKTRLPWRWATVMVATVLLILLTLAAFLDGIQANLLTWNFWKINAEGSLLIIYIMVAHIFMWRLRERAIQAFRPLLALDEDDFDRLAAEVARPKRGWEWTVVLIGIGLTVVLSQPWTLSWGSGELWLSVHMVITGTLMNGLFTWLIYDTLAGAVRINQLSRRKMKLDIFVTEPLTPIALWSLGISLGFAGGVSLSLVFVSLESLLRPQSIIMYGILICVTVLIFFISMWSAHRAMAEAKKRELEQTRENLAAASNELKDQAVQGKLGEMQGLTSAVTSYATYYRLVKEAPTWPFSAGIVRRLLASTIVPVLVYLTKIFAGVGIRF